MLLTAAALAAITCLQNARLGRFYTFKCARFAKKKGIFVRVSIHLATQQNKWMKLTIFGRENPGKVRFLF